MNKDCPVLTTVVGSYPVPDWLVAYPSEQGLVDATSVVFRTQELAGIDRCTDGELYRFDPNHPDTNGMIDYFVRPLSGVRSAIGLADLDAFQKLPGMGFRAQPAAVVEGPIGAGTLNLLQDYRRAAALAPAGFKFTLTGPHMLSKTLLDKHYSSKSELALALAQVLAEQVRRIDATAVQIDEANISGHPEDAEWAAEAINIVLDAVQGIKAVHICFGNYGGQTIQRGTWEPLINFLNSLRTNHFVLEMARRPADLEYLKGVRPDIDLGIGVIDVKTTIVETADEVAARIEQAQAKLGPRVKWVHPDCGFWMLKRTIADRKMRALVEGRDLFLGRKPNKK